MKRLVLLAALLTLAFSPVRTPETCGIFQIRQKAGGLWEMQVGCDSYKAWLTPSSIRVDPQAYYPIGLIYDDGTFIQDHLRGCFAQYGCDPTGDGVRVEVDGQVQYVGLWQIRLPVVDK